MRQHLRSTLNKPIFGRTPNTPHRITTLVDIEIARHAHLFQPYLRSARPLLERWFTEHPQQQQLSSSERQRIVVTAMRAEHEILSDEQQTSIILSQVLSTATLSRSDSLAFYDCLASFEYNVPGAWLWTPLDGRLGDAAHECLAHTFGCVLPLSRAQ